MDCIIKGLSRGKKIRFIFADVTAAANELAGRHGVSGTAARVLGEALAAAALLSADGNRSDESVQVQLRCDGPLQGFHVEATGTGDLRGFTQVKSLPGPDRSGEAAVADVMGRRGILNVTVSTPGAVLYSGQVDASPPEVRSALARYYNRSLQVPTGVELSVRSGGDRLIRAVAIAAQKMPDGDTGAFVGVLEAFQGGQVLQMLETRQGEEPLWKVFGLPDVESVDSRELRFGCRCSSEKVIASIASMTTEEIREMADAGHPQEVTCHMCGQLYEIEEEILLEILVNKVGKS
jgi:molecular chaperone Hsp33